MKPILAFRLNSLRVGLMIALCAESGASAATIHVSGGGAALNNTIAGAVGGDEIIVDDSLDYTPVNITNQLFIHAATGQTPRVVADPTVAGGQAVGVNGAGENGSWGGINIVQNVAGGGGGHNVIGVYNAGATQTQPYLLTNCTIRIDLSGASADLGRSIRRHLDTAAWDTIFSGL